MYQGQARGVFFGIFVFVFVFVFSNVQADELTLYVVKPKYSIDWSTPRSLMTSTFANYLGTEYARIGHFAVELSCSNAVLNGNKVLTGMVPKTKTGVYDESKDKAMGLAVLYSSFSGRLKKSTEEMATIAEAREDGRLKVLRIPTSATRCDQMVRFLTDWISHGSYTVYGGGKNTEEGEGAGCADFAMEFFKIATGGNVPPQWKIGLNIPNKLIGNKGHPLSYLDLWMNGERWAKQNEPHKYFEIPDPGFVFSWIQSQQQTQHDDFLYSDHVVSGNVLYDAKKGFTTLVNELAAELLPVAIKPFQFTPKKVTDDEIKNNWENILKPEFHIVAKTQIPVT